MSRLRQADIFLEMIELCHELMAEVRQQLVYYRASVYKDETASQINRKIEQLRLVTGLFLDELVQEPLQDYDALSKTGAMSLVPGECSYSKRVTCLLSSLEDQLESLGKRLATKDQNGGTDITRNVQMHRNELLALCRYGSRQWAFFQAL